MKMSQHALFRSVCFAQCLVNRGTTAFCQINLVNRTQACCYAKKVAAKGKGKSTIKQDFKAPEVCKDPETLTSYAVGVNIFKEGNDPKLKSPEEYPEWLFQLHLGKAKTLAELDEGTWEYYRRLRKEKIWRYNRLSKGRKF